jgi:hypothetical protein
MSMKQRRRIVDAGGHIANVALHSRRLTIKVCLILTTGFFSLVFLLVRPRVKVPMQLDGRAIVASAKLDTTNKGQKWTLPILVMHTNRKYSALSKHTVGSEPV